MDLEETKKIIETFLHQMSITDATIELTIDDHGDTKCVINTASSGMLIGKDGRNWSALSHLIKKIVAKKAGQEDLRITVDVNNYLAEKMQKIKSSVEMLAERARSLGAPVEMSPMNAYERLIVHSMFEHRPEFKTESTGIGPERRVVITYVGPGGASDLFTG